MRRLLLLLSLGLAACAPELTLDSPIGAEGGLVRTGDGLAELIVPPGALAEDVQITITPWEGAVPTAAIAPAWDFQPDGLQFLSPVTLRIALNADLADEEVDGVTLGWLEGNEFFPIDGESALSDGVVEGQTTHFTPYTVVGGSDGDGDGFTVAGGDCDDGDASVYPGAPEVCDGLDNDCDGMVPQGELDNNGDGLPDCTGVDADGDSYPGGPAGSDCDDNDPQVYPGAPELCDGIDNNCDGIVPTDEGDANGNGILDCDENPTGNDNDGDGFPSSGALIIDCDDNDPTIYPGAPETCNGLDDDCDGVVPVAEQDGNGNGIPDCSEPLTCFNALDDDGDGWIDLEDPACMANPQSGSESDGYGTGACNDGLDNDADGQVDADDAGCTSATDTDEQ